HSVACLATSQNLLGTRTIALGGQMNRIIARFAAAAACTALATAANAQAPRKVTVFMFAVPSGPIVPYYYGVGAGIYKKHGLDVQLRVLGGGSLNGNQLVMQSQGDFAVADTTSYLEMRAQGTPIVSVMGAIQGDASAVVVHKSSNITKPIDLKGRKIAVVN